MGALVGGLAAADRLDDFTRWASSLTQGAVLRLLDPSISAAVVTDAWRRTAPKAVVAAFESERA